MQIAGQELLDSLLNIEYIEDQPRIIAERRDDA